MITNTNDDSIDKVASSIQQLWPMQVLEEYKQWHSHDVLLTEDIQYMKRRRKFAIMYYSCPDRTGNIFHNMYNSILWSIITNRTLLVKFDETDGINTIEQCADIIQLSSWVPLYDVWSAKLDIQTNDFNDTNTNNDNNSDDSNSIPIVPIPIDTEREIYDGQNQVVIFPQIQDIHHHDKTHITRNTWRNDPLDLPNYRLVRFFYFYQYLFISCKVVCCSKYIFIFIRALSLLSLHSF